MVDVDVPSYNHRFMRPPLAWALALLAGCAGPRRDPLPALPATDGRRERDDAVVALMNGEPLTWRTVAERMLETDPRTAVETYVRWRVVEDRKRELGIAFAPEELRRRAELHVAQARKGLPEAEFRARLASEGITEKEYVDRLAGSGWLAQLLALETVVRTQSMMDGTMTVDRVLFAEEAEARRFAGRVKDAGFDAAAAELKGEGRRRVARETFARSAPPQDPPLDAWIVEALDGLQPGQVTDVESSRADLKVVARLVAKQPGRPAPSRRESLEEVLRNPPAPEEIRAWIASRAAAVRLEYPAGPRTNN